MYFHWTSVHIMYINVFDCLAHMKEEVHLEEIKDKIGRAYVKLDEQFTKILFIDASESPIPHYNLEFAKSLGCKVNSKYKLSTAIRGWFFGKRFIPLKKLGVLVTLSGYAWSDIEKHLEYMKSYCRSPQKINFPIRLDLKLGSLVGHILGDGCIDKKYGQVFFSNSDVGLLNEFIKNMDDVFGIRPRIWMQEKSKYGATKWDKRINSIGELIQGRCAGLFYPAICGKILHCIFEDFANGKKKLITEKILCTPATFKAGLLRAFFDDEGTCHQRSIRLFQSNDDILLKIKKMLLSFGICSNKISSYVRNNRLHYYFDITHRNNLICYHKNIGFTSPNKKSILNLYVNKRHETIERYPIAVF